MILFYSFMIAVGFPQTSKGYPLICPKAAERLLRTKSHCIDTNTSKYYCLLDDNEKLYTERCRSTEKLEKKGSKYVVRGGFDGEVCSVERYQPFIFNTSDSSDCVYQKSSCSEVGLIYFNNGTTTEDRQCRCDYTKGYAFTSIPSSRCYCIPSKEDCSCYKKPCDKTTKLSQDYECVTENKNTVFVCPESSINYWNHDTIHVISVEEETDWLFWTSRILVIVTLAGMFIVLAVTCLVRRCKLAQKQNDISSTDKAPEQQQQSVFEQEEPKENDISSTDKAPEEQQQSVVGQEEPKENDISSTDKAPEEQQQSVFEQEEPKGTANTQSHQNVGNEERELPNINKIEVIDNSTDITLKCTARSIQEIKSIKWKKSTNEKKNEMKEIKEDKKKFIYENRTEKASSILSLTILNPDIDDTGKYACVVENECGSSKSQDIFLGIPDIINGPSEYTTIIGGTVQLQCSIDPTGLFKYKLPLNKIIWKCLTTNREFETESLSLLLESVEENDFGTYICVVYNAIGSSKSREITLQKLNDDTEQASTSTSPQKYGELTKIKSQREMGLCSPLVYSKPPEEPEPKNDLQIETKGKVSVNAQVVLEGDELEKARKKLQEFLDEEIRVVLIGKAGVGKSATGNSILSLGRRPDGQRDDFFATGYDAEAVTKECTIKKVVIQNDKFLIIDTPGVFSDQSKEKEIEMEIKRCIHVASTGLHAIIFVMEFGRIREEDRKAVKTFMKYFGKHLRNFLVIVFTHYDKLKPGESFTKWLEKTIDALRDPDVKELFKECENRICVIANNADVHVKETQVKCIMETIKTRRAINGLKHYTDANIKRAEQNLQKIENDRIGKEFKATINISNTEKKLTKEEIEKFAKFYKERVIEFRKELRESLLKMGAEKEILDSFELRTPDVDNNEEY